MEVEADKYKDQGNKLFTLVKYEEAAKCYTQAINILSSGVKSAIYYSNRAFCYIKMENFGSAMVDAEIAMKEDPQYIKAYYRRGMALLSLNKIELAVADFKRVVQMCPNDTEAAKKYDEANKELKWRRLGEALGYEEDLKDVDISTIKVESSYQGPVLENTEAISLEWTTKLMEYLKTEKNLHKKYLIMMIYKVRDILAKMQTLTELTIEGDYTIVGDVHGQYYDLLNIFKINGLPGKDNIYLFNGDFVDRGSFSVEVIVTLMAWKLLYPNYVFLNRGNHETKNMNSLYGFKGEVVAKYEEKVYLMFLDLFQKLPICYVINKKVMLVHGGLFSNDTVALADIKKINRFCEPADSGVMCECLWSDPINEKGRTPSKRGVGICFGPDVAEKFLDANGLSLLVRSHEMKPEGYEFQTGNRVVTVFSAPNYCDQMNNKGAILRFIGGSDIPKPIQFMAQEHPKKPAMAYANPLMKFM